MKGLIRLVRNSVQSPVSSVMGGCASYQMIVDGIATKNWELVIKGAAILVLGLITNEKGSSEPETTKEAYKK